MLSDKLKSDVLDLTHEEKMELEHYLLKIRLEGDEKYWERIRQKVGNYAPSSSNNSSQRQSVA